MKTVAHKQCYNFFLSFSLFFLDGAIRMMDLGDLSALGFEYVTNNKNNKNAFIRFLRGSLPKIPIIFT